MIALKAPFLVVFFSLKNLFSTPDTKNDDDDD